MKKGLKILLIAITSLFLVSNAKAYTIKVNSKYTRTEATPVSVSDNSLSYGNSEYKNAYSMYKYIYVDSDSEKSFRAYCADPDKHGGSGYKVDRILGSTSSKKINAHDMGILEIIKKGLNDYNNSYTYTVKGGTYESINEGVSGDYTATLTGDELYIATSIAVRSFTLGLFGWIRGNGISTSSSYAQYLTSAIVNSGASWAGWYPELANAITGKSCSGDHDAVTKCYQAGINGYDRNSYKKDARFIMKTPASSTRAHAIIYGAMNLFREGLQAAKNYLDAAENEPSVKLTKVGKTKKETKDGVIYQYEQMNLAIKNIDKETGEVKGFKFECPDCNAYGIEGKIQYYKAEDSSWVDISENTNVAKFFPTNDKYYEGNLQLRLVITRHDNDTCDFQVNGNVSYKYWTPNKYDTEGYIGAILKPLGDTDQRFYIIEKETDDGDDDKDWIEGKLEFQITCDDSDPCPTEIKEPECEGTIGSIKAPEDIKKCILFNKDDADNSYKLITANGGVDNSYCSVFCKEDYNTIQLQKAVEGVRCGSYFSLNATIKGNKDCYVGSSTTSDKSIDRAKYTADIQNAQKTMIAGYDLVLKAQAAAGGEIECKEVKGDCNGSATGCTLSGTYNGYKAVVTEGNPTVPAESREGSYGYGSAASCSTKWDTCGGDPYKCTKDGKEATCYTPTYPCCGTSTCKSGATTAEIKAAIASDLAAGKQMIADGKKAYDEAIKNFNACTTGWSNATDFFHQKIEYSYTEHLSDNSMSTAYYDLLKQSPNENAMYLEEAGSATKDNSITVWTTSVDDKYATGGTAINKNADNGGSESYASVFGNETYTVCTDSGCTSKVESISKAKFVKKSVVMEQDYITPSVFYQTTHYGRITIQDGYANNVVIDHALPVSAKATGGGIFKLFIKDLGEFYDKSNMVGRLIDYDGGSDGTDNSVATALIEKGTDYSFAGDYACTFEIDCRDKNCPPCKLICDPEVETCEWTPCLGCKTICINCIFDLGKLTIKTKTISTTTIEESYSKRDYGYNWITKTEMNEMDLSTDIRNALDLTSDKAASTVEEIQNIGETVYDYDVNKPTDSDSLAFSIVLNKDIINELKEYNKDHENVGGYGNDSLECYSDDKYKNIYCYSEVIDQLIKDHSEKIIYDSRRYMSNREHSGESGYWTLWDISKYGEGVIGGPAWK